MGLEENTWSKEVKVQLEIQMILVGHSIVLILYGHISIMVSLFWNEWTSLGAANESWGRQRRRRKRQLPQASMQFLNDGVSVFSQNVLSKAGRFYFSRNDINAEVARPGNTI